jgi:hypothetical protein
MLTTDQIAQLNNSCEAMQRAGAGTLLANLEAVVNRVTAAPVAGDVTLNAGKTIVTIPYDKVIFNAFADAASLKAKVTFASNGTTFNALGGSDTVTIVGYNLVITFASALSGATNKIKVGADSLISAYGVKNVEVITAAISAA